MRRALRALAGVAVFLALWEAASRAHLVDPAYVPPPSVVLVALGSSLRNPVFVAGAASTVLSWLIAVALATVLGTSLGLLLGSVPRLRSASMMVVEFFRPLPGVALIPLVIALIGTDAQTKIALATFASVWPVLFNTVYALGELDPQLVDVARSLRVRRWRIALWVALPSTVPFVLTGIRFATAVALISLVSTEFLTSGTVGLGQFISVSGSSAGRMDLVLAGTVFAGLLGCAADVLIGAAQRRWVPWSHAGEA